MFHVTFSWLSLSQDFMNRKLATDIFRVVQRIQSKCLSTNQLHHNALDVELDKLNPAGNQGSDDHGSKVCNNSQQQNRTLSVRLVLMCIASNDYTTLLEVLNRKKISSRSRVNSKCTRCVQIRCADDRRHQLSTKVGKPLRRTYFRVASLGKYLRSIRS